MLAVWLKDPYVDSSYLHQSDEKPYPGLHQEVLPIMPSRIDETEISQSGTVEGRSPAGHFTIRSLTPPALPPLCPPQNPARHLYWTDWNILIH